LAGILAAALGGCAAGPAEPRNLSDLKAELRAYHQTGAYLAEVTAVCREVESWIARRAAEGGRLVAVIDLDDTLWSNWPYFEAQDFGYVPAAWERWVAEARAPALVPVVELVRGLPGRGVAIVFLTARRERERAATRRNLRAIGVAEGARLICQPDTDERPNAAFKAAARAELRAEGWSVIVNLGDQASDLAGGGAERAFKLPNPFYRTD
jgi:acid phosphatase